MTDKSPSELIKDFFHELNNTEASNLRKALAGDYSGVGRFSPIGQEFVDDDNYLFGIALPSVVQLLADEEFGKELVEFERKKLATEIDRLYANLSNSRLGEGALIALIDAKEKSFGNLSIEVLEEQANAVFRSVILLAIRNPSKNQTEKNYFYAYLLKIAYERFLQRSALDRKYNRVGSKENLIYQYYMSLDIDIEKHDQQFRKYNLYSVDDDSEIFVALPSRIIDKKNNLQFIVEMQEALLRTLVNSKQSDYISDLALLARSQFPIESDQHVSILLGTYQAPTAPKIQKLYSNRFPYVMQDVIESQTVSEDKLFSSNVIYKFHEAGCDDQVWVFSKGNSVEFEEILGDHEVLDDCVVTQMIHLKYLTDDDGRIRISHIDHEYLFYSYEEFDQRLKDYTQRAGAKKRIKTFKVDRSKIPLVFEDGTFFLYAVLEAYFTRAYFLQEFLVRGCGFKDVAKMMRKIQGDMSAPKS